MTTARGEALWTRFRWQRGQDTDPRELGYERTRRATAVRLISPDQPRFRRPVRVTMSRLFAAISARPVPKSVPNTAAASRTQTDAGRMCGRFWPPAGSRCQKATRTTNHPPRRYTGWATARTNCSSRPSSVGQTQHGLDATGAGLLDGSKRPQIGRGPHEARAILR